jgi:hypothetical protein
VSSTEFVRDLSAFFEQNHPTVAGAPNFLSSLQYTFSDQIIDLPGPVFAAASAAIHEIFHYAHSPLHTEHVARQLSVEDLLVFKAPATASSVLMAYDFHYDSAADQLSLIEINTNASLFLYADALCRFRELDPRPPKGAGSPWTDAPLSASPRDLLVESFKAEHAVRHGALQSVALIDEHPESQKAYPEFLLYQELFQRHGIPLEILSFDDPRIRQKGCMIYNRYTDFVFGRSESHLLREIFLSDEQCVSPHPREYLLLSDKPRMADLWEAGVARSVLIPQKRFRDFGTAEELWSQRRRFFFKPTRSHGSKAVFNGGTISRKRFNEIFPLDFIAQEIRKPGSHNHSTVPGEWKYDLRFYVYKDQIQNVVARLYQGQLTNFATPGGGLAAVSWR